MTSLRVICEERANCIEKQLNSSRYKIAKDNFTRTDEKT